MLPVYEFVFAFHPNRFTEFPLRPPNRAELIVTTIAERRRWCHHWRLYRYRAGMVAEYYRRKREVFFSATLHDPHAARVLARLKQPSAGMPEIAPIAGTTIVVPALWVSLYPANDDAVERDALPALAEAMPLRPSCAISTAVGFDFYWLLREPWITEALAEQTAAAAMLRGWQEAVRRRTQWRGFAVEQQDLGQMMRFPESFDLRGEKPRPVIIETMSDARYDRRDFERLLPGLRAQLALPPGQRARDDAQDAVEEIRRDLVHGLYALLHQLGGRATSAQILAALERDDAGEHESLRVALYELFPGNEPGELPSAVSLGCRLRHLRGRRYDGLSIAEGSRNRNGVHWTVDA